MSETILGVIIGALIAVIVSVIQGFFTNRNTAREISARQQEQNQQFEFQRREAQTERLINIRRSYLEPIRQANHAIAEQLNSAAIQTQVMISRFVGPIGIENGAAIKRELDTLDEKIVSMIQTIIVITPIMFQNSDAELAHKIEVLSSNLIEIRKLYNEVRGWFRSLWEGALSNEEQEHKPSLTSLSNELRNMQVKVLEVNIRIETLLSGG